MESEQEKFYPSDTYREIFVKKKDDCARECQDDVHNGTSICAGFQFNPQRSVHKCYLKYAMRLSKNYTGRVGDHKVISGRFVDCYRSKTEQFHLFTFLLLTFRLFLFQAIIQHTMRTIIT